MGYRILIATGMSPAFRQYVRQHHPDWERYDYHRLRQAYLFESFGWSDAYALEFHRLGCQAETVLVGVPEVQFRWAYEHGPQAVAWEARTLEKARQVVERTGIGLSALQQRQRQLLNAIFLAQVRDFRPDILLVQLQTPLAAATLRAARAYCRLIVAQLASRFPAYLDLFGVYDLILSAFPHYVRFFNECGLRSAYMPLAFEPVFLERCRQRYGDVTERDYGAVFIGSVSDMHAERLRWLAALAESGLVDIWLSFDRGMAAAALPSVLRERARPPVYGLAMYDVYRRARIALNAHPEIAGPYAAILRMYEVTGCGALLLTDDRSNMADLFTPGVEVVTYRDTGECLERLAYYLAHPDEAAAIACRGQERTYRQHLFAHRAAQILDLVRPLLAA